MSRRALLAAAAAWAVTVRPSISQPTPGAAMYGLIGKMTAVAGKRDELVAILTEMIDMPGCLSYIVATDPADANGIWVTEVWDNEASHKASLGLPVVKAAISRGRPLIAGFESSTVTTPIGGHGLPRRAGG